MPGRAVKNLTPRQEETLAWVKNFTREHGMPPTVREIGDAFGIKSSSVFYLLKALERKGCLRRGNLGARSLIVKDQEPRRECTCRDVPIVGRIAAGLPVEEFEHDAGSLTFRRDLLHGREAYALKVEGRSMVEAGILDGDYVIVRKQETADDGDIVVALIENEATLKRLRKEKNRVRLDPANREMAPIYVASKELRIRGKVVGVLRIMDRSAR